MEQPFGVLSVPGYLQASSMMANALRALEVLWLLDILSFTAGGKNTLDQMQ